MPVQNPERVATKQDLKDFYDIIFPYLGGNAEAGFTPIGTIIALMGNSAPTNYLACNGQVVNIADYPELANYFLAQFGSRNKFGGNGTTTFGIPDLRGEFLRGTGSNGHSGQGSGLSVGSHQDATLHLYYGYNNDNNLWYQSNHYMNSSDMYPTNYENLLTDSSAKTGKVYRPGETFTGSGEYAYRARPTNTSVLFCIATKNIYMNPSLSYTEEEQVVGQWINGKPLYQKTLTKTISKTEGVWTDLESLPDSNVVKFEGYGFGGGQYYPVPYSSGGTIYLSFRYASEKIQYITGDSNWMNNNTVYLTIQYTKTTD